MAGFTHKVQTPQGCFDISFQETTPDENNEYLVTIIEDDYAAPPFLMQRTDGCWKIPGVAGVAVWVRQLEGVLNQVLLDTVGQSGTAV